MIMHISNLFFCVLYTNTFTLPCEAMHLLPQPHSVRAFARHRDGRDQRHGHRHVGQLHLQVELMARRHKVASCVLFYILVQKNFFLASVFQRLKVNIKWISFKVIL